MVARCNDPKYFTAKLAKTANLALYSEQKTREEEGRMKTIALGALIAVLAISAPAFASAAEQSGQTLAAVGEIKDLDWAHNTLTLDTGKRFTLPPMFPYQTFPALGQYVKVFYVEEGGRSVVRWIDNGQTKSNLLRRNSGDTILNACLRDERGIAV